MSAVTKEEIQEARRLAVWGTLLMFLATFTQSLVGIIGYGKDGDAYN